MGAILDKIKSLGPAFVDEKTKTERLNICKACEHYIASTTNCKKCGCFMGIKSKVKNAVCPIGKW